MKISDILKIVNDCDNIRDVILQDKRDLTDKETYKLCDLLWDYKNELLNKEVK